MEEALKGSAGLGPRHITVERDGGQVRLSGSLGSFAEKHEPDAPRGPLPASTVENYITIAPGQARAARLREPKKHSRTAHFTRPKRLFSSALLSDCSSRRRRPGRCSPEH